MADKLYDTGTPQRVVVVNDEPPETAVARAQADTLRYMDQMMANLVEYCARQAGRNTQGNRARREPPEATRARGPVIDAEFEVVREPRQLAAPKPARKKKRRRK